jgi:hypothetical protein
MSKLQFKIPLIPTLLVASFILGLSTVLSFSFAQNAVSSQSLEVSPPSQELASDPGQIITAKAKVRNKSADSLNIKVRIEDFTASGEGGQVALIEEGPQSLTSWAAVEPQSFTLKPGEAKEVVAKISVPKEAAGGRYGSFVFSVGGGPATPGTASVAQELASLFLIRISGPVSEKLFIAEFSAPAFLEFGPVPFTIKFQNSGNVHVKPFGLLNITDVFGRVVKDVVVRGETNIFPQASRVITVSYDERWLFGPYKAQAVLNYGSKNESLYATTTFFVFPARIAAAALLVLFVLYIGRRRLTKTIKALAGK